MQHDDNQVQREHIPVDDTCNQLRRGLVKGFAQRTYSANVAARNNAGTADKCGADVGNDSTVQVRHDHDIELTRLRDKLHRTGRAQSG